MSRKVSATSMLPHLLTSGESRDVPSLYIIQEGLQGLISKVKCSLPDLLLRISHLWEGRSLRQFSLSREQFQWINLKIFRTESWALLTLHSSASLWRKTVFPLTFIFLHPCTLRPYLPCFNYTWTPLENFMEERLYSGFSHVQIRLWEYNNLIWHQQNSQNNSEFQIQLWILSIMSTSGKKIVTELYFGRWTWQLLFIGFKNRSGWFSLGNTGMPLTKNSTMAQR